MSFIVNVPYMTRANSFPAFSESRPRPTILMPAMSPFLSEAKVTRWMKKEGESFVAGESLVQIVRLTSTHHTFILLTAAS